MAGQAYAVATGKAPAKRERRGHGGGAGHALAEFDELIAEALTNPVPVQKAAQ